MGKYSIPPEAQEGFKLISELSSDKINALSSVLQKAKVGESIKKIYEDNKPELQSINDNDYRKILWSLRSLGRIFKGSKEKEQIETFAKEFSESYKDAVVGVEAQKVEAFNKNLIQLLHSYNYIKFSDKAYKLLTDNKCNYSEARVISDIRMVFDDNEMQRKDQLAVIVHHLRIKYFSSGEPERHNFFISMDLNDLKNLKEIIERAMEKDTSIKNNNHNLAFIEVN